MLFLALFGTGSEMKPARSGCVLVTARSKESAAKQAAQLLDKKGFVHSYLQIRHVVVHKTEDESLLVGLWHSKVAISDAFMLTG